VKIIRRWAWLLILLLLVAGGGFLYWQNEFADRLPEGIVVSNGRIEATQISISAKLAGRVKEVLVAEGEMVEPGQVTARLDAEEVTAQLKSAEAEVRRLERSRDDVEAAVKSSQSQLKLAGQMLARAKKLVKGNFASEETVEQRTTEYQSAEANYTSALARVKETEELINSAKQNVRRIEAQLDDLILRAPLRGRIQYRLVEPGEVVAAGGNVFTLLNLADVYMTIFLSAADAGRLVLGSEARIILDPVPEYVIPARVTFVAAEAQFTPRSVETEDEREKLMFRVKLSIDPDLLRKYEDRVKAGVRGNAYVRLPPADVWPEDLQVKLPE
jgi:HlyD family secretion protein